MKRTPQGGEKRPICGRVMAALLKVKTPALIPIVGFRVRVSGMNTTHTKRKLGSTTRRCDIH